MQETTKPNLLVVMVRYPDPPQTGSAIIAFNSIKYLSRHYAVHLVCLGELQAGKGALSEFVERVEMVPVRCMPLLDAVYGAWVKAGTAVWPLTLAWSKSRKMQDRVGEIIEESNIDVVLLFEIEAMQYVHPRYRARVIANIEDPYSIKLGRMSMLPVYTSWQRIRLKWMSWFMARYERRLLPAMGRVLVLSAVDEQELSRQGGYTNLGCMTYGVESESGDRNTFGQRTDGMIIFSGSMYHPPNVDGIVNFLDKVFGEVLRGYPSAELWIVGANPDSRIHDAAAKHGRHVVITGKVDDISAYISKARVSICPIRLEIGIQTKILEALSLGTPVVTMRAGNRGIAGRSGIELWVEDAPDKFAARIVDLLRGIGWEELSQKGRQLAQERFTWNRSISDLEKNIRLVLQKNKEVSC